MEKSFLENEGGKKKRKGMFPSKIEKEKGGGTGKVCCRQEGREGGGEIQLRGEEGEKRREGKRVGRRRKRRNLFPSSEKKKKTSLSCGRERKKYRKKRKGSRSLALDLRREKGGELSLSLR